VPKEHKGDEHGRRVVTRIHLGQTGWQRR
jgi:hypothetical protein